MYFLHCCSFSLPPGYSQSEMDSGPPPGGFYSLIQITAPAVFILQGPRSRQDWAVAHPAQVPRVIEFCHSALLVSVTTLPQNANTEEVPGYHFLDSETGGCSCSKFFESEHKCSVHTWFPWINELLL